MMQVAHIEALKSGSVAPGSAHVDGAVIKAAVLSTPITHADRSEAMAKVEQVRCGVGCAVGLGIIGGLAIGAATNPPPVVYAPPPAYYGPPPGYVYETVPQYYGWMGQPYYAPPPYAPGFTVILQGSRYYRVPADTWRYHRHYGW